MTKDEVISKLAQYGSTYRIPKEAVADIMGDILRSTPLEDITDIKFDKKRCICSNNKKEDCSF